MSLTFCFICLQLMVILILWWNFPTVNSLCVSTSMESQGTYSDWCLTIKTLVNFNTQLLKRIKPYFCKLKIYFFNTLHYRILNAIVTCSVLYLTCFIMMVYVSTLCLCVIGVTVNGALIGAPAPVGSHKEQRTYFSTITIVANKPRRSYIEVTPQKVILDGLERMILPTGSSISVETAHLGVVLIANANLTVTVQGTIKFVILFHHYKNPAPYQRDHLGFYIANSKGLSNDTHGLLGKHML